MGRAIAITLHQEHVNNIMDTIARAEPATIEVARGWYKDWSVYLTHRAEVDGLPIDTAIVAFAWLSSNKSLDKNLYLFEQYIFNGARNVIGLSGVQRNKLLAIHMSGNPLQFLTSPKVRSFAINLLANLENVSDPYIEALVKRIRRQATKDQTVTIDRHAAQCAYNDRSITRVPLWMYKTVSLAYQTVAAMLGWSAEEVQAVAWVQWRMEKKNSKGRTKGVADPDARALLAWSAGVKA